jgi:iron complex outermembrane receptor protein
VIEDELMKNVGMLKRSFKRSLVGAVALGALLAGAGGAFAQEAGPQQANKDIVIVTGTRQVGLTAADSPAPIQVLDIGSLEKTGQPDLIQALAQNVPSFNAQAFGGDTANLTLSAKLRGLSPNHALVLIDGKRRHGTANLAVLGGAFQGGASADLNFVPVASIDHIEVLLDGAAAQYGTDAIAGVINIIQKKNSSGGQLTVSGGQYMDGGGDTADVTGNIGFAPTAQSFFNITAEAKYHNFSDRGNPDPRAFNTPTNVGSSNRLSNYPNIINSPDYPNMNHISGDAEYRLYTLAFNSGIDISEALSLYASGSYGDKFAQAYENWRTPARVVNAAGVRARPFGFNPKESISEKDYAVTLGGKGVLAGWNYDLSTTYGKDDNDVNNLNSLNASLYFDTGTSPTNFHVGDFIGSQWTTNFDIRNSFGIGLANPLDFAAGVEYREDKYEIKSGDAASRYKEGSQAYPGFSLSDAGKHGRNSKAAYIDLALKPVDDLLLDAAVRYEDFSDFGDTTIGKLTGRYDFSPAFALRGTISTGFRAPTLAEEFYSATNVSPTSAFVQLPPNAPAARLIGINGLKAEKSKSFSAGFVAHPIEKLTVTLDAYEIKIDNRIAGSGALYGTGGSPNSPNVTRAIIANGNVLDPTVTFTGINIFANGLDTRTRGVDFVATYPTDFGSYGSVDWSLTGTYNDTKVTKIAPPPSGLAAGVALYDATAISDLEDAQPKYRVVAGALWSIGKWSINYRATLYGKSSEMEINENADGYLKTEIKQRLLGDLDITYAVTDSVKISVGANNLFNAYPDRRNAQLVAEEFAGNDNASVAQYPSFSPYGINGGYYYAKLSYSF